MEEHGHSQQVGNSFLCLYMYMLENYYVRVPKSNLYGAGVKCHLPVLFPLDSTQNLKHLLNQDFSETLLLSITIEKQWLLF